VAAEALLPELAEPRVAPVGVRLEAEVVLVEVGDLGRVELHRDAAGDVFLDAVDHVRAVRPAVAVATNNNNNNNKHICIIIIIIIFFKPTSTKPQAEKLG